MYDTFKDKIKNGKLAKIRTRTWASVKKILVLPMAAGIVIGLNGTALSQDKTTEKTSDASNSAAETYIVDKNNDGKIDRHEERDYKRYLADTNKDNIRRDRKEDIRDRREDRRDRREDVHDHREDRRDRRKDVRDHRKNRQHRREGVRDRRVDRRSRFGYARGPGVDRRGRNGEYGEKRQYRHQSRERIGVDRDRGAHKQNHYRGQPGNRSNRQRGDAFQGTHGNRGRAKGYGRPKL